MTATAKKSDEVKEIVKQATAEIEHFKDRLIAVLPKHVDPVGFVKIACKAVALNPKLATADRQSLIFSLMQAAELGLRPNTVLQECHLIPYWDARAQAEVVQMIPGYRGLMALARRSGQVTVIDALVVYQGEKFSYRVGEMPVHEPDFDAFEQGKPRFPYAFAKIRSEEQPIVEVVPRWKVERIKATSLAKIKKDKQQYTPWVQHEMEMWRKTAVRALFKYLPVSTEEIQRALEIDRDAAEQRGEAGPIDFSDLDMAPVDDGAVEERTPSATERLKAKARGAASAAGAEQPTASTEPADRPSTPEQREKFLGLARQAYGIAFDPVAKLHELVGVQVERFEDATEKEIAAASAEVEKAIAKAKK